MRLPRMRRDNWLGSARRPPRSRHGPHPTVLQGRGATMVPLFGYGDRVAMAVSRGPQLPHGVPDLTTYYRVVADDQHLDQLAQELLKLDVVDGAFVKPKPEPPVVRE